MRPGLFFLARWAICSALLVGGAPALAQQAGGQLGGQQQPGIQQPASRPAAATRLPGARSARVTPRSTADAGLPPLVALPLFLGEAKFSNPQLSNDGKLLAYIKPDSKGVPNVFVRELPEQVIPARPAAVPLPRSASKAGAAAAKAVAAAAATPAGASLFDAAGTDGDIQVTSDGSRGVSAYNWAEDASSIYFIQDTEGDENYHLYLARVPLAGSSAQAGAGAIDLTPFPGVKAQGFMSNENHPDTIYISLNRRDATVFDLYSLDAQTLKLTLHTVNPGDVTNWLFDYNFNVRGAECYNNTDGSSYVIINDAPSSKVPAQQAPAAKRVAGARSTPTKADVSQAAALFERAAKERWSGKQWVAASSSRADASTWRRIITWPFGEEGGVFRFNKAGDGLYVLSSLGRDTTALQLISTAPGGRVLQEIATNPHANVGPVDFHPVEWTPQMVAWNYLKTQWQVLDPKMKTEWERIEAFRPGEEVSMVDSSLHQTVWILAYSSESVNSKFYVYRRGQWPPQLLFNSQPDLLPLGRRAIARTHGVVIPARDGLPLPSYLTLPVHKGVPQANLPQCVTGNVPGLPAVDKQGVAAKRTPASAAACPLSLKLPLVLSVHGGPWTRDTWGSDGSVQLLANRGYAVLQVNYRGSSGYGKRFMNLGNKQWGTGSMQHDLTDAVRWAIEKGIADPQRVCIMGGSYGGYAVLAGLAFTPQLYACGVDLVGISNVASFMKSIPPYWQPLRYEWLHRVGNVEGNATLNRRISPLFHVDKIRAPLFIAQGANDPRVPQAESDQMFTAMKAKGLDVRYMLYSDEGHGLDRAANRLDYNSRVEQFLAEHLGGRAAAPLEVKDAAARVISSAADLSAIAAEEQREEAKAAAAAAAAGGGGSSPSGGSQPADAAPVGAAATAAVNTRRRVPG